jgi:DNA-binding cell septation regulator SpoVG
MQVTDVKIWPYKSNTNGSFLGNGSVTFDNSFFVKFMIYKSPKNGDIYVSWPSRKGKGSTDSGSEKWYQDAGFVIDDKSENPFADKNRIEEILIKAYNAEVGITKKDSSKENVSSNQEANKTEEAPPVKKTPLIKLKR